MGAERTSSVDGKRGSPARAARPTGAAMSRRVTSMEEVLHSLQVLHVLQDLQDLHILQDMQDLHILQDLQVLQVLHILHNT